MRDNTFDSAEIRWEVLKSMLDNFPKLMDRTEKYILEKRSRMQPSPADHAEPDVRELVQKAVFEYRAERLQE